jgi:hypothetical protein
VEVNQRPPGGLAEVRGEPGRQPAREGRNQRVAQPHDAVYAGGENSVCREQAAPAARPRPLWTRL